MKLKLPHKTVDLDMTASIEKRLCFIEKLLTERIDTQEGIISIEEYFRMTFDKPNTRVCMDIIGYYLTKEAKVLEILSNDKQKEMIRGSRRHTTFSGMSFDDKIKHGVIEVDDSNYE